MIVRGCCASASRIDVNSASRYVMVRDETGTPVATVTLTVEPSDDIRQHVVDGWYWAVLRERHGFIDLALDGRPVPRNAVGILNERVERAPPVEIAAAPVAGVIVLAGADMLAVPIRLNLHELWRPCIANARHEVGEGLMDTHEVVPFHDSC